MSVKISMCAVSAIIFGVKRGHDDTMILDDGTEFKDGLPDLIQVEGVSYKFVGYTCSDKDRSAHYERSEANPPIDPTTLKFINKVRGFRPNNPEAVDQLIAALEKYPNIKKDREQDWVFARWADKSLTPGRFVYLDLLTAE